jgi:hypothetical protein
MLPLPASKRLVASSQIESLKIRGEGKLPEISMGNSHDDASEAEKAPNHPAFPLQNGLPVVKVRRIRAEKRRFQFADAARTRSPTNGESQMSEAGSETLSVTECLSAMRATWDCKAQHEEPIRRDLTRNSQP